VKSAPVRAVIDTLIRKYCDHLPLYRQSVLVERETGVEISRRDHGWWGDAGGRNAGAPGLATAALSWPLVPPILLAPLLQSDPWRLAFACRL